MAAEFAPVPGYFSVSIAKEDFKFNAAHFIAHRGGPRERLHGHNYRVQVRLTGGHSLSPHGYLMDFGEVKKTVRAVCKSLDERFLCPMESDGMEITEVEQQLCLRCEDGSVFQFPRGDCALLPLRHSSCEELAHYLWCRTIR